MMSLDRRPRMGARRASLINASYYRASARQPPVIWDLQGVRGQMSTNCLWHACRALFAGLLIFGIGTVMCISGFYADGVFNESSNATRTYYSREMYVRDPARQVKFSRLSYIGPIVMGVGGFVIVATCVMTFEARDSAAKVGPAAFGTTTGATHAHPQSSKSRREVRSVGSQTQSSSLSGSTLQLFDRKHLMEAFRKFSKTLRSSSSVSSLQGNEFHRSPSAPSLLNATLPGRRGSSSNISSTRRFLQKTKPRIPPALRQAMSVDCSNDPNAHPLVSMRQNSSTQTLTLPPTTAILPRSAVTMTAHPRIQRSIYSTSSECNPSTTSNVTLNEESETKIRFENEIILRSVNASVHFDSETNDQFTSGFIRPGAITSSFCSLRPQSPHPSCCSEEVLDVSPAKSEQLTKSPTLPKPMLRSAEHSYNRPSLLRQPKVDYPEINSDEDEPTLVVPSDDLSTILE